ncbi:fungal-specific transcription factor domain-containing protein [Favolaschia claudopus]|uniref:Fungal-specific transcription factor domain-containing protein n=1 Tax=Favolaschia claudopus TaxID=2862362 RepID=A0AAW0BJQ6_9AGAR
MTTPSTSSRQRRRDANIRDNSCAECLRLKLRCDKKGPPCTSCVSRGCEGICPDGTLFTSGRGRRSMIFQVAELNTVIARMGERIQSLQEALLNAGIPPHKQRIFMEADVRNIADSTPSQSGEVTGSLRVNADGDTVYFGPTAGCAALFTSPTPPDPSSPENERFLLTALTSSFPFSPSPSSTTHPTSAVPPWSTASATAHLLAHLPPEVRAWSLCDLYYRNGCWTGMPVLQSQTVELLSLIYHDIDIAPPVYMPPNYLNPFDHTPSTSTSQSKNKQSTNDDGDRDTRDTDEDTPLATPTQLALIYLIFALGALVDLDLPAYNREAEQYFDLASAAMSIDSVFRSDEEEEGEGRGRKGVERVQALVLFACWYAHGGRGYSVAAAWGMVGLAGQVGKKLGLHRESYGAKLSEKLATRCRALFWETFYIETMFGLSLGRPTGTILAEIDCPLPPDESEDTQPFLKLFPGYLHARWEFVRNVTAPIMERFTTTIRPSYKTVLEMDRLIRKHMHRCPCARFPKVEGEPPSAYAQRELLPLMSNFYIMYIHAGSFVEAIRDNAAHPFDSAYTHSFAAAWMTALHTIRRHKQIFTAHRELYRRWWPIRDSLLNAAMIIGALAMRYPARKPHHPHALLGLFLAVDLLEKLGEEVEHPLTILRGHLDKAVQLHSICNRGAPLNPRTGQSMIVPIDRKVDQDLELFAGTTDVVQRVKRKPTFALTADPPPAPPRQQQQHPVKRTLPMDSNSSLGLNNSDSPSSGEDDVDAWMRELNASIAQTCAADPVFETTAAHMGLQEKLSSENSVLGSGEGMLEALDEFGFPMSVGGEGGFDLSSGLVDGLGVGMELNGKEFEFGGEEFWPDLIPGLSQSARRNSSEKGKTASEPVEMRYHVGLAQCLECLDMLL